MNWSDQFNICAFLDTHHYQLPLKHYSAILAVGAVRLFKAEQDNYLDELKKWAVKDWMFGHFSYGYKTGPDSVHSSLPDRLGFPASFFFIPETIFLLTENELRIESCSAEPEELFESLNKFPFQREISRQSQLSMQKEEMQGEEWLLHRELKNKGTMLNDVSRNQKLQFSPRLSKTEYIEKINTLKAHIARGDCYEINFCQEFYAENAEINPITIYARLSEISPTPFAAYYKIDDHFLICASPERFLQKRGSTICSQPIKGTWERNRHNEEADMHNQYLLQNDPKERAENVMIVDLVRNDLSKFCKEGTVKVKELCGVYPFPQVHQMISTICGEVSDELHWTDAIKASFPMGSMTGAPKYRVTELIEQYEVTHRGLYSGAIGYVSPVGDFDFNVVIRSLLYNQTEKYLSYQVGSGITFYADPEKEYEECLLKAEAIKRIFEPD
ncbi:MAG TPA: anthranilate synthase component I family protein [Parasegetibacter sp.]